MIELGFLEDVNYLKKYDIIHYHRSLGPDYNRSAKAVKLIQNLGIVDIMDLDDYWLPNKEHPAYMMIKNNNMDKLIVENLSLAGNVTTTTPTFKIEIEKYCKHTHILPNAVNPEEKQFNINPEETSKVRVGWLGGSSHLADLQILNGVVGKLSPIKDKIQFVLCGYDVRGTTTQINQETGEQKTRKIEPHESVWYKYESIFTDGYKTIDVDYKNFLNEFKQEEYGNPGNLPYRRVWTRPITTYADNYNKFDISLAPLKHHTFNRVKSQLKVIEAGFHKKALIVQDFGPYQIDCINAIEKGGKINPDGNCLMVEKNKNHKLWAKYIKMLVEDSELRKMLGENLHRDVQKYHIKNVTKNRAELYKKLVKENKKQPITQ